MRSRLLPRWPISERSPLGHDLKTKLWSFQKKFRVSGIRDGLAWRAQRVRVLASRRWKHREFERLVNGPEIFSAICDSRQRAIGQEIERRRLLFLEDNRLISEIGTTELGLEKSSLGLYDEGQTVAQSAQFSRCPRDGAFLYALCAILRPRTCLELGTNIGISSAYLAAGMRAAVGGSLITLEASPVRAILARQLHSKIGLPRLDCRIGLFADTLVPALESLGSADLAFVDGHHQYEATLNYWNLIAPCCPPGAVVVFDDTRWSEGMIQAWGELKRDTRFSAVIDLGWLGVCIVGNGPGRLVDARGIY